MQKRTNTILALVCTAMLLVSSLAVAIPFASAEWAPTLSANAEEKNFDTATLPLMAAPYSEGFYGDQSNTVPVANSGGSIAHCAAASYWLALPSGDATRFAMEVENPKDFAFVVNAEKVDDATVAAGLKVYAAKGFTVDGDVATPVNPTELAVTYALADVQPTNGSMSQYVLSCAQDIPADTTVIYLMYAKSMLTAASGTSWGDGLIDFDYVSDAGVPAPVWTPVLSVNAIEKNYDTADLPLMAAPYSEGYYGDQSNTVPVANKTEANIAQHAAKAYWLSLPSGDATRFAMDVENPKDFRFVVNAKKTDASTVAAGLKVYAAEGFTVDGGVATPANPTELTVTYALADVQPANGNMSQYVLSCAQDIPADTTVIYLVYAKTMLTAASGVSWGDGLIDFDYVSDRGWSPILSENAEEKNFDAENLPLMAAPYSYGHYGDQSNTVPVVNKTEANIAQHAAKAYWLALPSGDDVRFAMDVENAKDFRFVVNAKKTDASTVAAGLKVYAAEGFTVDSGVATPVNPTELAVTYALADVQPANGGMSQYVISCAQDIPADTTVIYLVYAKTMLTAASGVSWGDGLVDFDYVADAGEALDPYLPLPDYVDAGENKEIVDDFSGDSLIVDDGGKAFDISNLEAGEMQLGAENEPVNALAFIAEGVDAYIVYNYANITSVDVRGWSRNQLLDADTTVIIEVSEDGDAWTAVDGTLRTSVKKNRYSEFSILANTVPANTNYVRVLFPDTTDMMYDDLVLTGVQILYTGASSNGNEDNSEDNNAGGNDAGDNNAGGNNESNNGSEANKDDEKPTSPETGVGFPAAAMLLTAVSAAALGLSKRRK